MSIMVPTTHINKHNWFFHPFAIYPFGLLFFVLPLIFINPVAKADSTSPWYKYQKLAHAQQQQKKYDAAEAILSAGILKYPKAASLYYSRATLRADWLGKRREALDDFSMVIKLNDRTCSQCLKAYCYRGIGLYKLGLYELAVKDLTRSLKIIPKYNKARVYRAYAFAKLGRTPLAIRDAQEAIKRGAHADKAKKLLQKIQNGETDY